MGRLRPFNLAELASLIWEASDDEQRDKYERWYWAKSVDVHGAVATQWHRDELQWLRDHPWEPG